MKGPTVLDPDLSEQFENWLNEHPGLEDMIKEWCKDWYREKEKNDE